MRRAVRFKGCRVAAIAIVLVFVTATSSRTQATPPGARAIAQSETRTACDASHASALAPRRFDFPRDDGAHDDYAVEWWRTFGRVEDDAHNRFDFTVNVSRFAIDPTGATIDTAKSRWSARHLVTVSYELLDEASLTVARGTFVDREDALGASVARDGLAIVAKALRFSRNAQAHGGNARFALALRDTSEANALSIEQTPVKAAVALGPGGVMQTGSCVSNAAYAYAYTRNATRGVLRMHGIDHTVSGSTWIEHEFAHRELGPRDAGWDRFEVQFDDGRDLDARMTRATNGAVVATSGVFVAASGAVTYLSPGNALDSLPPAANAGSAGWQSNASGIMYPALWYLAVKPANLGLATVEMTHDQEVRETGRTPYYWGAIVVEKAAPPGGDPGHGFVELTGYAGRRSL